MFSLPRWSEFSGAQDTRPDYLDPEPILQAAETAIGADRLSCVTITGTAYAGMVGQQRLNGYEVDWPRGEPLTNYVCSMNWSDGTMREAFEREPGHNPASWKYGLGWRGGTAIQEHRQQTFAVNGEHGWSIDGPGADPVAATPEDAEIWQLDDLLQRIHTWVADPVLGDFNYEHEFTNDSYVDLGDGIRFPTGWHSHRLTTVWRSSSRATSRSWRRPWTKAETSR